MDLAGIPREQIPRYPSIDPTRCLGDRSASRSAPTGSIVGTPTSAARWWTSPSTAPSGGTDVQAFAGRDVVVVEDRVERLMWLALADLHTRAGVVWRAARPSFRPRAWTRLLSRSGADG